jgi:hypothetical protein
MHEKKRRTRPVSVTRSKRCSQLRIFESESMTLQTMQLRKTPKPEIPVQGGEKSPYRLEFSPELILSLIKCIKSI